MANNELISVATRWLQAGYSVIPINHDKVAVGKWGARQETPFTEAELEAAFNQPGVERLAVVAGYAGLTCFDFDPDKHNRALEPFHIIEDFYNLWLSKAVEVGVAPAVQDTQSGGRHALIKCPDPFGSTKLANVPAAADAKGNEFHTVIETRGSGGYFVLHDLTLDPLSIPSVTQEQHHALLTAAMDLDRLAADEGAQRLAQAQRGTGQKANATRRGLVGWFNDRYTVQDILQRNGYKRIHNKYISPSSTSGNAGVVIFEDENGYELCFSHHSDVLGDGRAHDAFDTFKLIEHDGKFDRARKAVEREKGKGRFTFTPPEPEQPRARARRPSSEMSTNTTNAVTDATTICAQPMSTNQKMSTNAHDLSSNTQANEHKSKNTGKPVHNGQTSFTLTQDTDLCSNDEHKQSVPSPSQKPDLSSNNTTPTRGEAQPGIRRWGERARPPDVQWLAHHLIQDNAENLIAGEPGVGKSWISGDLAVAVATGSPFLDRHTQQGAVLIINFDDPSESLPRMFAERSARGRSYSFDELDIYYWQPEENQPYPEEGIATPNTFAFLLAEIKRIKPRLIIVDAYTSAFPHLDGNKGQDVIEAFEVLRQLRNAAPKPCTMVLIDHTPKATLQDSKRRGVSGSQQKHAKTRTVHIIRTVDPGDVNGDDVLEWEVFKANAAPRQESFGVDRQMNAVFDTATLTVRSLPERGSGAKNDRAAKTAITFLRSRAGETVPRKELLAEVVAIANVSMATARRGLDSNEFLDHPQIRTVEMGGRGNPQGFLYEPDEFSGASLYERFREVVQQQDSPFKQRDLILEYFARADAGDDDAKDRIDEYLRKEEVRNALMRPAPPKGAPT